MHLHIFFRTETIKMPPETTVKNYQQGIIILKNLNPKNTLDIPLSPPLQEPPTGNSGATLITNSKDGVINNINKDEPEELIVTTKQVDVQPETTILSTNNDNSQKEIDYSNIESVPVRTVEVPPENLYKDAPFNRYFVTRS